MGRIRALPPKYEGVLSKDKKTLRLTSIPNKVMAKVSGLRPVTKVYRMKP